MLGALGGIYPLINLLTRSKEGSFHPILDLKHLNMFLKILPFQMLRAANVLRYVMRKFLQFSFKKQAHQFKVLPSGLSLAPLEWPVYFMHSLLFRYCGKVNITEDISVQP